MELPSTCAEAGASVLARLYVAVNVWAGACMILKLGGDCFIKFCNMKC